MAKRHLLPASYLIAVLLAETAVRRGQPGLGLVVLSFLFIGLLHHAAFRRSRVEALFLAISLVVLARMLTLVLPVGAIEPPYWQLAVSVPTVVGIVLAARAVRYGRAELGLVVEPRALLLALVATPVGLVWGMVDYLLIKPPPLVSSLMLADALVPALALLASTGFAEELLFRGFLQGAAVRWLGPFTGAAFSTLLFAIIATDPWTMSQLILVLGAGAVLAIYRAVTNSVLPSAAGHGAFSIGLFIIAPFVLQG